MKALIFAAGLGERMRPLTDRTPKPLLAVAGKPLIVWHIEKLAAFGVRDIVVNTSWLAGQFMPALGDGARWNVRLHYLHEGPIPLETGGGMLHALPALGDAPFLLLNGDVWTDLDLATLPPEPRGLAHLVMVDRPAHATHGDFALDADGHVRAEGANALTYAGIGLYRPALLDDWQEHVVAEASPATGKPRFKLAPILRAAMARDAVTGQHHRGAWTDVGTPQRLAELEAQLA